MKPQKVPTRIYGQVNKYEREKSIDFIFFHRSHRLRPFELSQAWKIHQMKTSGTEAKPRQIIFKPLIALNLEASLERLQNLIKVDLERRSK